MIFSLPGKIFPCPWVTVGPDLGYFWHSWLKYFISTLGVDVWDPECGDSGSKAKMIIILTPFPMKIWIWDMLWEILSYERKFCLVTENFFLWQETLYCDKKFLPLTGNFFLTLDFFLLLAGNFFNISSFWNRIMTKVHGFFVTSQNHNKRQWF